MVIKEGSYLLQPSQNLLPVSWILFSSSAVHRSKMRGAGVSSEGSNCLHSSTPNTLSRPATNLYHHTHHYTSGPRNSSRLQLITYATMSSVTEQCLGFHVTRNCLLCGQFPGNRPFCYWQPTRQWDTDLYYCILLVYVTENHTTNVHENRTILMTITKKYKVKDSS